MEQLEDVRKLSSKLYFVFEHLSTEKLDFLNPTSSYHQKCNINKRA